MSKKVIRIKESQLKLMVNRIIKEQVSPYPAKKNKKEPQQPVPVQPKIKDNNGREIKLPYIKDENTLSQFLEIGSSVLTAAGFNVQPWINQQKLDVENARKKSSDPMFKNNVNYQENINQSISRAYNDSGLMTLDKIFMAVLNIAACYSFNGDDVSGNKLPTDSILRYVDYFTKDSIQNPSASQILRSWFENGILNKQEFFTVCKNLVDSKIKLIGGDPNKLVGTPEQDAQATQQK
jgi:hypothetical protein